MAKSKSGGTRSYIRGRVGADVYSIGKDGAGKKQQIVRSLAETVANPRTINQMRGRMIMYTVMQALSGLKPIVDHSFDNVSGTRQNLSEFVKRNYALIKADIAAHPAEGNEFGLNMYQEHGAKGGKYIIASGDAAWPAVIARQSGGQFSYISESGTMTVASFKADTGLTANDYLTVVAIASDGSVKFARLRLDPAAADADALAADKFLVEANDDPDFTFTGGVSFSFGFTEDIVSVGYIVSKASADGYQHNNAVMMLKDANPAYTSDIALPTYPVGESTFLNGGDLFGLSESEGEGTQGGGD